MLRYDAAAPPLREQHDSGDGAARTIAAATDTPGAAVPVWRDGLFWLTLALTVFALAPFMLPGYFWGANDARHHVYFLFEYDRVVQDGIWWPRWSPDFAFGFGYPFFNIYGPLSHFLAELLRHFLHFGYTQAIETVFGLSIVGSAAAMYLYVRSWMGRPAAVVAALAYVYIPYHLLNLYVRANLAESVAFVWLPLCLWTVRATVVRPGFRWIVGLAVSFAGLMLTSNLVVVLFTPLLALYTLALTFVHAAGRGDGRARGVEWLRRVWPPLVGGVAGLGLSAVFWLPMLLERQYVRVDQWFDGRYDFHGHFVYWFQLFGTQWGFGVSQPGPDDPIGFQIGLVPLLLAVAGTYLVWRRAGRLRWEIGALWVAGAGAALLALTWAAPLWELPVIGGVLGAAQFPWRWFSLTALAVSALAGLPLMGAPDDGRSALSLMLVALVAVVILGSYGLLRVEISEPVEGPIGLPALMRFQQSSDEMTGSTAWVKEIPTWSPMADEYLTKERLGEPVTPVASMVDYTTLNYNRETGFVVNSEGRATVREDVWYWSPLPGRRIIFNQFYYPGWRAYLLDGAGGQPVEQLPIIPEEEGTLGRMTVPVPVGEGYVRLIYEDTPPRVVGRTLSQVTAAALALLWVGLAWWQRRERVPE